MTVADLPDDPTTDAALRSWVEVSPDSSFPIQNLPFGVAVITPGEEPRVVSRIGDHVLDLRELDEAGLFDGTPLDGRGIFAHAALNPLMSLGRPAWRAVRERLSSLLREETPALRDDDDLRRKVLSPASHVEMLLPVAIGDYTDFYSSREHATNVGTMFRGAENALMPNWVHLPVAYHGRASSVVVSGTPVRRPRGQTVAGEAETPTFGPSRLLDFELELGFFVGSGNELGEPIPIDQAHEHIFGLVLVNDWSARDIQKWEYQPLGPFNAKNFATSISPWVVTLDALSPFRRPGPRQDPLPLPYLAEPGPWGLDIQLEVALRSRAMREAQAQAKVIAVTNAQNLYWSIRQQLAHHTITGCNARPGDLMASGTISGPTPDSRGSLLELTWRGTEPIALPGGEERRFLADGDEVILRGWCQGQGYRIGFGDVRGVIEPPLDG